MIHQGVHMTSKKLKVENWPIEKLIPYARNPRKNDQAVEQVAAAIKEFGFRVPIVAKSDGLLVDGHLRLKAAQKLGLKEVPVVLADDLSDAQIKAFRISVNRMSELAEWDNELLTLEFAELKEIGFDTTLTGFDEIFVSKLITSESIETASEKEIEGAKELSENDFSDFEHKCPRCGFEFDSKD
jgi:ParB-like chromosome segregation protein Spo0J